MDSETFTILLFTVQRHFAYNPIFHFLTQIVPSLPLRGLSLSVANPNLYSYLLHCRLCLFALYRLLCPGVLKCSQLIVHIFLSGTELGISSRSRASIYWGIHLTSASGREVCFLWPFHSVLFLLSCSRHTGVEADEGRYRLFFDFYLKDLNLFFFFSCVWNFPLLEPAFFACYTWFVFYTILSNSLQDAYFTHAWENVLIIEWLYF